MDAILGAFQGFLGLKGKKDNDFFDRLSSRYTMILLLVFAALITFYQFGGYPIICWFPVHFTGSHMKFANNYCWIKNTYYLPYENEIPNEEEHEKRQMVTYYQWMPFILLTQAGLFFLPSLIWNAFNQKAGVDSDNILAAANTLSKTENEENREGVLYLVTQQIARFLGTRQHTRTIGGSRLKKWATAACHACGKRFSSYLVTLFLFSKLLYIANILFQLFILNHLLGTGYNMYGFEVMKGMLKPDHEWLEAETIAFPRVTMCDFNVRRLGNVHRYAVQCTLPLNLFNEKIYVFLWFWFVFVLVLTILGFLQWFIRAIMPSDRVLFIQNHLRNLGKLEDEIDVAMSENFVINYLCQDGVFMLRLISHNTNNITTTEIICHLWDNWREKVLNGKLKPTTEENGNSTEKLPLDSVDGDVVDGGPGDASTLPLKGADGGDSVV